MESFLFTDAERHLTTERQLKYQGTAKINLDQISFHPSVNIKVDQKNVDRISEIFRKDACRRLDIRNHVTAIVSRRYLRRALRAAGVTSGDLMTNRPTQYPHLHFALGQVRCLHGQHRLKAGEETLPPTERWWTVDIYLDDISPTLQNALVDEYANEKQPSDGEIYRKIRQYQHEHNACFQKRWWSRLSDNKAKRLRQLISSPDNVDLCAAFDGLLAIPGLWNGMSLGSLNKVLALKCDEEIVHYLKHIKRFWATLVDHDPTKMAKIDLHTVDSLQRHAPKASEADRKAVKGLVVSGEVFSEFSEPERLSIWHRLRSCEDCDSVIPSLHTFFRDISYLNACADVVKRLVVLTKQCPTIQKALGHSFRPRSANEDCQIQISETAFRRRPGNSAEQRESGYRQIWMYAMRWYPEIAKEEQSHVVKAKPTRATADENAIYDMAALARKLGFHSKQIEDVLKQSPDRQIARAALLRARRADRYHYDSSSFESLIDRVVEVFSHAVPNENEPAIELIASRAVSLKDRCGPPLVQAQRLDRPRLFLDQLHTVPSLQRHVSSFYVRQSVYFAFFGRPSMSNTGLRTPERHSQELSPARFSPLFFPDEGHSVHDGIQVTAELQARNGHEGQSTSRAQMREIRRAQRRYRREQRREERRRRRQEPREERETEEAPAIPRGLSFRNSPASEGSAMSYATMAMAVAPERPRASISGGSQSNSEEGRSVQVQHATEGAFSEISEEEPLQIEEGPTEIMQTNTDQEQGPWENGSVSTINTEDGSVRREQEQSQREADQAAAEPTRQENLQREAEPAERERQQHEARETAVEQERLAGERESRSGREVLRETEGDVATHSNSLGDNGSQMQPDDAQGITAVNVGKTLDGLLQGEVRRNLVGSEDIHERDQLTEGPGEAARDAHVEEARVAQQREIAHAQLQEQDNPLSSDDRGASAHNPQRVTQLDLPTMIARWRQRASKPDGDDTERQQLRPSKSAGLRKSRLKTKPTHRDINRLGTLDAAISDELGWDLEASNPAPILPAQALHIAGEAVPDVQPDDQTPFRPVPEMQEPNLSVPLMERSSDRVTADVEPVSGHADQDASHDRFSDRRQELFEETTISSTNHTVTDQARHHPSTAAMSVGAADHSEHAALASEKLSGIPSQGNQGTSPMATESAEEALGLAQQEQRGSAADPERVRKEWDQRAAAERALFEEDADNQLHPSEVLTRLDGPEPTHSPQTETIEISSSANDQPSHSTETNPNFESHEATPPAQSWRISKTAARHERPPRPLGIKATRDKAKQRQSKATSPPGIGQTQVDKTASDRKVTRTRRASKIITQIDFRAWAERNHTVGVSQMELRGAKRPRALENEVEEVCIRPQTSDAGLASSNQTKRLRSTGPQDGDEQMPSDINEVVQQVLPPAPITGQIVGSGTNSSATPAGRNVTITFRAYQRGEWRKLDTISVNTLNPHEAQKVADRYARAEGKNARFYDRTLRKVSVNQCVRAAIDDRTYTVLMSLGRELHVTRQRIASVARLFDEGLQDSGVSTDEEL